MQLTRGIQLSALKPNESLTIVCNVFIWMIFCVYWIVQLPNVFGYLANWTMAARLAKAIQCVKYEQHVYDEWLIAADTMCVDSAYVAVRV